MADTLATPTEQNTSETPADRIAKEFYNLIYHTPPEVVQEMDDRIRELRRRNHRTACPCILCWRAG